MSKAHIPQVIAIRSMLKQFCRYKILIFPNWRDRKKKKNKENGQIKGMIRSSMLIPFYAIQQVIPNICTKFQNPRRSSSWEIFDTNFPMYYTGVRDWKKEKWKKKTKINHSILVFFPTIYLPPLKMYTKFEDSGSHRSWEICNRKFAWRETKMDKQREW